MRSKLFWLSVSAFFVLSCSSKPTTESNTPEEKEDPPPPIGQVFPLAKDKAARLLSRLPLLEELASDIQELSLRDRSLPPPKPGKTLQLAFAPTEDTAPVPTSDKLTMVRHAPDGEVPIAPTLSLTFSRPMVALGEAKKLTPEEIPVKLTPQPEGEWRWLGDKTLVFEPALDRMPGATEYLVEVPAGTKSALGETIEAAQSFTFATPAPRMTASYPNIATPVGLSPVVLMIFDQRVDADAILKSLQVKGTKEKLHTATDKEVEGNEVAKSYTKGLTPKTWAAFAFDAPLSPNTSVQVTLPAGSFSAEGPRATKRELSVSFNTYGAFNATSAGCAYVGAPKCSPQDGWYVYFSNPVAYQKLKKESFQIEPAPKSYSVSAYGGLDVYIYGEFEPQTTYKLTVKRDLLDSFEQTLSAEKSFTIKVGDANPELTGPAQTNVVLDPLGNPSFSIFSVGYKTLDVSLYSVETSQYKAFNDYINNRYYTPRPTAPGTLISTKTLEITDYNKRVESRIDVSEALKDGLGQVVVIVKPPSTTPKPTEYYYYEPEVSVWVQSTKIGIDAFTDNTDLVAYISSLQDGTPLAGVEVGLTTSAVRATSDENGMVRLALPPTIFSGSYNQLIAKKGSDSAILTAPWSGSVGYYQSTPDQLVWYIFDDRHLYRPGEEAKIKGWIRRNNYGKSGDLSGLNKAVTKVSYTLRDSMYNEISKGTADVNDLGGFDLSLKLPPTMNLGYANLELSSNTIFMNGKEAYHSFQVEEFRRPEFEVKVASNEGPFFINSTATFTTTAAYYTGGGLPNAPVTWEITTSPSYFSPPNQSDYSFGRASNPYYWDFGGFTPPTPANPPQKIEGFTSEAGTHETKVELLPLDKPQAQSVTAQATVMDVNQQAWAGSQSIIIHPSSLYVGLKSNKYFVEKDQVYPVDIIVSDIDGKLVPQKKVSLKFSKITWEQEGGKSTEKEGTPENCDVTSEEKPNACEFRPKEGGQYRVTATVTDDLGRSNESQLTVYVSGETNASRTLEQERVIMIPDQKEYKPGDTAKILVISPFSPAEGVLLVRRSGVVKSEHFSIKDGSATVEVPIEEGHVPGLQVSVALSGQATRAGKDGKPDETLPKRPAFGSGVVSLSVPAKNRTLAVEVKPKAKEIAPGVDTSIEVLIKDANGKPVRAADVALIVVDEAVLSLGGYSTPDPIANFYGYRYDPTAEYRLRSFLQLEDPTKMPPPPPPGGGAYGDLDGLQQRGVFNSPVSTASVVAQNAAPAMEEAETKSSPEKPKMARAELGRMGGLMADGDFEQQAAATPIQTRTEFGALALFVGSATTDKKGIAKIKYKLPDNLTRYRVIAVAASGEKSFGVGEETITAKLPLMARASAPRFLNFGDKALIPVVLQNLTDKPMTVKVAMRATSLVSIKEDGFIATVPANDRLEVRFTATVQKTGTVRFQVAAAGTGKAQDASEFSLPIYTPATTEANALYGVVDGNDVVAQPISTPKDAFSGFGGLEISTSSTALAALTDAVIYLISYPYECSEQISSRVLAVASLKDVLTAFHAPGLPSAEAMTLQLSADLKRLKNMQHSSGGFDFWRNDRKPWPYLSVHVTHAMARAKEKGFSVDPSMLSQAQYYLQSIESYLYDERYNDEAKDVIIAYALYVRMLLGDVDTNRAKTLLAKGTDKLSIEAVGWILAVLSKDSSATKEIAEIKTFLLSRVTESAGEAHFTTSYREEDSYVLLSSDRRADAILLDALIRVNTANPDDNTKDLIVKLVAGLLNHKVEGRWSSTQENSFVLIALDNYFNTYEKATPDFVAKAWLGDGYAGAQEFKGRSTDQKSLMVPMSALMETGDQSIFTIAKEGEGRLYYRLGLKYAPKNLDLKPVDFGFTVSRTYEAVDNADDVKRDADGTWRIKAGARIRVKLQMVAPTRRYHVALVDPLPAGFEALNPALNGTGTLPPDPSADSQNSFGEEFGFWGRYYWWWGPWYQHENLRDERVEAFTTLLWEGVHKYAYIARATTPGEFIVPPTKAEEMYSPEIFGRAATEHVIIEAPANGL